MKHTSLFYPGFEGNELFDSGNYLLTKLAKLLLLLISLRSRCPVGYVAVGNHYFLDFSNPSPVLSDTTLR